MRRKEASLYPVVKEFLKEQKGCFKIATRKGSQDLGQADVIGIKSTGKELMNDFEVIVVEVKTNLKSFGQKIGQALGYSVYANRCYLAATANFEETHKNFATQLGVGLIEIYGKKCREILSAPVHSPNEYEIRFILRKLKLVRCAICGDCMEEKGTTQRSYKSIQENKPYLLHGTRDKPKEGKIFLCHICVTSLSKIYQKSNTDRGDFIIEKNIKDKKVKSKLLNIMRQLETLNGINYVPRKNHICYNLNGRNFLEIHLKQTKFIVNIRTKKRNIKDSSGLLRRKRGNNKMLTVSKDADIGKVISTIKRTYKLEK